MSPGERPWTSHCWTTQTGRTSATTGPINNKSEMVIAKIFQLNTHKSKDSLATLIDEQFISNNNIALIQEPPLRQGEVIGYANPLICLQTGEKPRAAIIHNPSLEIWQLPHLSDRDCQTAIWRNAKQNPILIVSAYWDITYDKIPIMLTNAIKNAKEKKYDIIIGIDSNAHHPAWGSPDSNPRGMRMENFINKFNLHILNDGIHPTFKRINCATHIDLTLTSTHLMPKKVAGKF